VVHTAEFRQSATGERCLWTAQVLVSDVAGASQRTLERIGLLLQQGAYMAENPLRSGFMRLMDLTRDRVFPDVPSELLPRPLVLAVARDQEVIDDGSGGYAMRERAMIYRFGYEIDARLTDSQLAKVLPIVVDSVTAVLTLLESGLDCPPPDLENWLDDPSLALALEGSKAPPAIPEAPPVSPLLKSSGTPLGSSGKKGLGGGLPSTGLISGSTAAAVPEIDEDALGHNPYAIWPARSADLSARMSSADPGIRKAALDEAANAGDGEAMWLLGMAALDEGDPWGAAAMWFERSANAGFPAGIGRVAAKYFGEDMEICFALFASAALCGNGAALAMIVSMTEATAGAPDALPQGLAILDDPSWIASFIKFGQGTLDEPARLPLYRRSAELGWPGSLGTITWWALLNGHLQLGLDQGYELMPLVSVDPQGNDPAYWSYQLGNLRSNMAYLRLCQGEDASRLAQELPMWSGQLGQGLAPVELFLIPQIARARSGDVAAARAAIAAWTPQQIDGCRSVAADMAAGRGPIVSIAAEIQALLP